MVFTSSSTLSSAPPRASFKDGGGCVTTFGAGACEVDAGVAESSVVGASVVGAGIVGAGIVGAGFVGACFVGACFVGGCVVGACVFPLTPCLVAWISSALVGTEITRTMLSPPATARSLLSWLKSSPYTPLGKVSRPMPVRDCASKIRSSFEPLPPAAIKRRPSTSHLENCAA